MSQFAGFDPEKNLFFLQLLKEPSKLLQHAFIFAREPNQLSSLHGGIGHWFFHEHVTTRTQELAGQIKMRNRRRDDVHRIGHSDSGFHGIKHRHTVLRSDGFGASGVGIK